jgi:membrane protease subunit HflK
MQLRFGVIAALVLIALSLRQLFMKRKEASQSDVDGFEDKSKVIHLRPKPVKGKYIILIVILAALLAMIGSSVYQLHEDEYAVITTFGVPHVVNTSGLKFKVPLIQRKSIVSKNVQGFPIGYNIHTNESVEDESVMISVDFNFVNVDFYVEYRVIDPVKYLYNSQDPVGILKMLCQSYIRDTIGLYNVDDVITTGKSEIQGAIKEKIVNRLQTEDLGLELVNIAMQDAEPPTREVQQAFKAVETSKQEAETAINNANKYANEELPAAEADADEILRQAEAYKAARIAEATGQASRFRELYAEYSRFPEITRQRLFYEMVAKVFPGMKVVILGEDGSELTTVLPLDEFVGTGDAETVNPYVSGEVSDLG